MTKITSLLLAGALFAAPVSSLRAAPGKTGAKGAAPKTTAARKTTGGKTTSGKATRTAVFSLPSMHCAGCAGGLTQASRNWPGVSAIRFNVAGKRATVTYNAKVTTPSKIQSYFARTGLPAKPVRS